MARKKKQRKPQAQIPAYLKERKQSNLFTFQKYRKIEGGKKKRAKHPKLIVEENGNIFGYMGLTESARQGHHDNIPLAKNPKRGDTRPAYIRKELRYDTSDNFYGILEDYNLTTKDKQAILAWLQKKKGKK